MAAMNPTYRAEILGPLFELIRARESCAIVGCASMGKSRLLRFLLEAETRAHYLREQADVTLFAYCDCNRLAEISEWGFFELILTAMVEACGQHADLHGLRNELNALRREVIISSGNALLARRHVELAALMLCRERGFRLCVILDEFDEAYRALPPLALANLRALRDDNKAWLSYLLVVRDHPKRIRPPAECEGFYELFSRSVIGLPPYSRSDAYAVIEQIEARRGRRLAPQARAALIEESGGHPGLIVAMFDELTEGRATPGDAVHEECRKLWMSLPPDEQIALYRLARGQPSPDACAIEGLALKGVVRNGQPFSPIFAQYVCAYGAPATNGRLVVDEHTRTVWVNGQARADLTAREFDLLAILARTPGRVHGRQEILEALHPGEHFEALHHNAVDALVKRVRKKIEPVADRPRYLVTVRGKGYKLITGDEGGRSDGRKDA
ncbi:MAG: winged helix-turn-helix domain-containing protein [Thermoflexales bacterium]|nr:winged helix-turn-helix domain-containing protein [Thermoflexales bacterium]